jgi:hypothetical protein
MAPYDIPTDQFALYEHSVHGIALLENLDPRAPSCATCHGTHGAAPPGFSEVANVCGSCHSATQDYFLSSPHNSDNPAAPKCVTCHGRYDVGEPSEAMFVGDDPRHCGSCHAPDSAIGQTVSDLHLSLTDASATLDEASAAVERAAALGRIVEEERSLLADARTHLITARAAQHTVDLEVVRREVETSVDLSLEAKVLAESGISASRFRRVAMVIAMAAIVLIIISLIMLRREHVSSRDTEDR